jgi:hypothetical protein
MGDAGEIGNQIPESQCLEMKGGAVNPVNPFAGRNQRIIFLIARLEPKHARPLKKNPFESRFMRRFEANKTVITPL